MNALNGWQRIGVVLSIIFGVLFGALEYQSLSLASTWHVPGSAVPEEAFDRADIEEALAFHSRTNKSADRCAAGTIRGDYQQYGDQYAVTCDVKSLEIWPGTIFMVILPAIIIFGLGYVIAWIVAGFRKRPA